MIENTYDNCKKLTQLSTDSMNVESLTEFYKLTMLDRMMADTEVFEAELDNLNIETQEELESKADVIKKSEDDINHAIEKITKKNVSLSQHPEKVDIYKGCSWDLYSKLQPEFEEGIDILYIDGAHDSLSVCRDIALYYPHVKPGGALIFDDYGAESVKKAADSCLSLFGNIENAFYTG